MRDLNVPLSIIVFILGLDISASTLYAVIIDWHCPFSDHFGPLLFL